MHHVCLSREDDFDGWREAARALALREVSADEVVWTVGGGVGDLFGRTGTPPAAPPSGAGFSVPRQFVDISESVAVHADPARWARLYRFLLRLRREPRLIDDAADPDRRTLEEMAKAVRRDIHKMRAFLRFREVEEEGGARFVAWYEPEHHIARVNAAFFVRRFATMRWSILTPEITLDWDGETLREGPGAERGDAPDGDPVEEVWKTYYASTFNPARVKVGAMLKEMPRKYWKNMPETALVPALIAGAQAREAGMVARSDAALATDRRGPGDNVGAAWAALREEARACTRCPLYKPATQTVFGEGPTDARLMFVGEQPGDQEDLAGRPFIGPAGQLFNRALAQAGIDRATVYVTNAVKHFKFEPRGKRRIHAKPDAGEIDACRWWIDQERTLVRPPVTVALGATAARSLFGRTMTISKARGQALALPDGGECWITVHPSYLLRLPDRAQAEQEFERFAEDLRVANARLATIAG